MKRWLKPKDPLAACAANYVAQTSAKLDRKTPCDSLRLLVIDSETTGFSPERDRMLSIATIEIANGQIDLAKSHQWMVFQPNAKLTSASVIHGILPSETERGQPEKEVLEELLPLLEHSVVIGHHIAFDVAMLNAAFLRHFGIRFRNPVVDTAMMARMELSAFHKSGYANQRPPSLDDVCAHLSLPMMARHTAEGDAFTTAEVFLLLSGRMRRRFKRPVLVKDLPISRP